MYNVCMVYTYTVATHLAKMARRWSAADSPSAPESDGPGNGAHDDDGSVEDFDVEMLGSMRAPEPEERVFDSWVACDEYMDSYFKRTRQLMRIRTTVSVESHNGDTLLKKEKRDAARAEEMALARAEGRAVKQARASRGVVLIPPEWGRYNRMWVCTHVGEYVPRGTGKRKKRKTRAANCEASFSACVKRDKHDKYHVEITRCIVQHSHPLSADRYQAYPRVRFQLDEQTLHEVEILLRRRASTEEIHRHIMESTPSLPHRYDVRNLVSRMKQRASSGRSSTLRSSASAQESTRTRGSTQESAHTRGRTGSGFYEAGRERGLESVQPNGGVESVFPSSRHTAGRELTRHTAEDIEDVEDDSDDAGFEIVESHSGSGDHVLDEQEKLAAARDVCDRILSAVAHLDTPQFNQAMPALEKVFGYIAGGAVEDLMARLSDAPSNTSEPNDHDHGVSFADFFVMENEESLSIKSVIDITSQLKVDPLVPDVSISPHAKPTAYRFTANGAKVLSNYQVVSVLPPQTLKLAQRAIDKHEKAHPEVPDKDVVVHVPGKGVFYAATIKSMHRWHEAAAFAKTAKAAHQWFCDVAGMEVREDWLQVPTPSSAQARLEQAEFNGSKANLIDFYSKHNISEAALRIVFKGIFGGDPVAFRACTSEEKAERKRRNRVEKRHGADLLVERDTLDDIVHIRDWARLQRDARWLFFPVFFSQRQHWAAVCVDKSTKTLHYFDPSARKLELDDIVKQDFAEVIGPSFKLCYVQPFVQDESCDSGVFVLMFAEHVIHKRIFPMRNRNWLQYLRYRYLCLGL